MTMTLDNGVRKTLASQIDRLDSILDGLAENLNEAVADSVKGAVTVAVQEAVHAALVEILSNAEVRRRLAANVQVTAMARLAEKARSCWNWLAGTAKAVLQGRGSHRGISCTGGFGFVRQPLTVGCFE